MDGLAKWKKIDKNQYLFSYKLRNVIEQIFALVCFTVCMIKFIRLPSLLRTAWNSRSKLRKHETHLSYWLVLISWKERDIWNVDCPANECYIYLLVSLILASVCQASLQWDSVWWMGANQRSSKSLVEYVNSAGEWSISPLICT